MRRIVCLLFVLVVLMTAAYAEAPLTLTTADTVAEVNQFVLLAEEGVLPQPQKGMVRFLSMNTKDPAYAASAWTGDAYDLTVKTGKNGESYRADFRNMHPRAAYCMALSYLGIDMTPVMMSEVIGSRDVAAPFDEVTATLPNVERVEVKAYVFDTMVENFLKDDSYSPVVCEVKKPNGSLHTVVIVGYIPETGGFIVCDPAAPKKDGVTMHAYNMCWHVVRQVVLFSDFYDAFYASEVQHVWQWRLTE